MTKMKHEWDKCRLTKLIAYIAGSLVFYQGYLHMKIFLDNSDANRYWRQFMGVLVAVCIIMAVHHLRHLIPKSVRAEIWKGAAWIFRKINKGFETVAKKIRKMLGIPEPVKRIKGRDERSFVFDMEDDGLFRRFTSKSNQLKWRDLEDNADKIRFLYIKFITRLRKKGYKYSVVSTPKETRRLWKLGEKEGDIMFPLYTVARYSGGRRAITDDEVELSQKFAKQKKP